MMKLLLPLLWLAAVSVYAAAETGQPRVIEFTASVEYIDVEGGFYALRADHEKSYIPLFLDDIFQQEGLRLRVSAEVKANMMGIHQRGAYIRILTLMPSNCHDVYVVYQE
jgi:hypothetical protein